MQQGKTNKFEKKNFLFFFYPPDVTDLVFFRMQG